MPRIQDLLVFTVRTRVRGNDLAAQHHVDPLDVDFDGHGLEGSTARHAVTVGVEADHLVLIHLGRVVKTGIEGVSRQRQRCRALAGETLADGLGLPLLDTVAVAQTTTPQVGVELGQVVHARHRRGPVLLQELHAPFHARLLLGPPHQTKERFKGVMTDQCLVAIVEPALPAHEQLRCHRLRVVPPQLARHATKEGEGLDQSVQDRLGAFTRQSQGERTIGVGPGHHQHRHLLAAIGEVDIDVAEVCFETLSRSVVQRNERLAPAVILTEHIVPHPLVAPGKAVLITQTAKQLGHRVPLLAWRLGVTPKNLVNDRFERVDHRRRLPTPVWLRLGMTEDLPNLPPRVMKTAGQFPDAHPVQRMRLANTCIFVHLDHPPPPCSWSPARATSLPEVLRVGPFSMRISGPGWARFGRGLPVGISC
jgi:hypothetical protein